MRASQPVAASCLCCMDAMRALQLVACAACTVDVFPEVLALYQFAAAHGVHLDFIWESRESVSLQHADMLSRLEDSSEVFLSHATFKRVCMHVSEGSRWGFPTLDVFAGHASQQHVVSRYYTQYHAPQALAVNAMYQCWKQDARLHGKPGMVWVFPPFPLIGAVINKLLFEEVDAIFIVPRFMRYWAAMLKQLPIKAVQELSYHASLYSIGSRAPSHMQGVNKPVYILTAYLVKFP